MMRSMTAFARQHRQVQGAVLYWELRSVNHRFLEVSLHLPEALRSLDMAARERIAATLKRGKVEAYLRLQDGAATGSSAGGTLQVNDDLVQQLLHAARRVNNLLDIPAPLSALEVLRWPGVLLTQESGTDDSLGPAALALLDDVLEELVGVRVREGAKIAAHIEQRCAALRTLVAQLHAQLPATLAHLRARLVSRMAGLGDGLDPARLEQEMLLLIQKSDVDEELERLDMHVKEISRVLHEQEPLGRRLDFLMQELNREANTLGAKAADTETTRASIEMKVIIEQMREQVQNVE